jgi:hypothetical protein
MAGKPTHGDSRGDRHPLFDVWRNMKARCYNPAWPQFKDWGGRGIVVCGEWKHDYVAFKMWAVENGYQRGLTLDRRDNNGSYEPGNCRWVTKKQNCRNRRTARVFAAFGEVKSLAEWAEDVRCKVKYYTLLNRLMNGWDAERALQQAVQR